MKLKFEKPKNTKYELLFYIPKTNKLVAWQFSYVTDRFLITKLVSFCYGTKVEYIGEV